MLKSYRSVGGGVVAHVILVSAQVLLVLTLGLWTQGPNPSFFLFGGTFIQLGSLLGQGLELRLGLGLDNSDFSVLESSMS